VGPSHHVTTEPVRPLIFHAADLGGTKIGGIQSFVRGFVQFAPDDFAIECVGTTSDPLQRPVGTWTSLDVDGRTIRYLAVQRTDPDERRSRVPVALAYTLSLVRRRPQIRTIGRVLNFHRAGIPLALIHSRSPRVQYVHLNVADIYAERGESRWRHLPGAYHRIEDLTIPSMDRVYVVNERGVRFYRERHPRHADRIGFLPTWYDPGIFRSPTPDERSASRLALRQRIGLPPDSRIVLFVGRLEAQKDPELVVEAFGRAARMLADLHLVIVGSGSMEGVVRRTADGRGLGTRVHTLGALPRRQVAEAMWAADALLLASRFEGMPITVIEALATGLPVVATAVGEVPRLVETGETGWLATDRAPEAVADGLVAILEGPLDPMRVAAVERAAVYRADRVLEPVYDVHRELAERAAMGRRNNPSGRL
jgi:glycosyltransferase involved in cell wall biosynthesis